MKKLLSLLLCYVFLQTETFALRGGPAGVSGNTVLGSYSGIMTETTGSGDIGLFLLSAVTDGASTGQFLIFTQGSTIVDPVTGVITTTGSSNTFQGSISGLTDATRGGSGKFVGVFSGTSTVQSTTSTQSVSGQMTVTATRSAVSSTQRLTGTATSRTLTIQNNVIIITSGGTTNTTVGPLRTYSIDGWQSSGSGQSSGFVLTGGTGS